MPLQGKSVANAIINFPLACVPVVTVVNKTLVCGDIRVNHTVTIAVTNRIPGNTLTVIQRTSVVEVVLTHCNVVAIVAQIN